MAITFPASPTDGEQFTVGARKWIYSTAKAAWLAATSLVDVPATATTAGTVPGIGGTALTNAATLRQLYRVINIDMGLASPTTTLTGGSIIAGAASLQNNIDQSTGITPLSTAQRVCSFAGNTGSNLAIPGALRFAFRGQYASSTANGIVRVFLGGTQAVASLATAGFGFELRAARVWIVAHNGTTLSTLDTGVSFSGTGFFEANLSNGVVTVTSFDWTTGTITTLGTLSGGPAVGTALVANVCIGSTNGADASNHRMFYGRSISIFY